MMRSIVTLEAQDLLQIAHCGAVFMFFVHRLTSLSADLTIITIVNGPRLKFNRRIFGAIPTWTAAQFTRSKNMTVAFKAHD